jgi:hypothetical protein
MVARGLWPAEVGSAFAVRPRNFGALKYSFYGRFKELPWHSLRILYHGGHPMSRFALFTVALFVLVMIGSQSRSSGSSLKSMCVCVPTRAKLMLKSAIVKTQARSAELFTSAQ